MAGSGTPASAVPRWSGGHVDGVLRDLHASPSVTTNVAKKIVSGALLACNAAVVPIVDEDSEIVALLAYGGEGIKGRRGNELVEITVAGGEADVLVAPGIFSTSSHPRLPMSHSSGARRGANEFIFFGGLNSYGFLSSAVARARRCGTCEYHWSNSVPSNQDPEPRFGNSLTTFEDGTMHSFGGFTRDPAGGRHNLRVDDGELYALAKPANSDADFIVSAGTWSVVESTGHAPCARAWHSALALSGIIIICGGTTNPENTSVLDDAFVFQGQNSTWSNVTMDGPGNPFARYGHGATLYHGAGFLVFGGSEHADGEHSRSNEMFIGKISNSSGVVGCKISMVEVTGTQPVPQHGATIAMLKASDGSDAIVVYGGQVYDAQRAYMPTLTTPDSTADETWIHKIWLGIHRTGVPRRAGGRAGTRAREAAAQEPHQPPVAPPPPPSKPAAKRPAAKPASRKPSSQKRPKS